MKVEVDRGLCIGCGLCSDTCPDIFELRDDGYSWLLDEDPPEAQWDCVREAAEICPVEAIVVEEG